MKTWKCNSIQFNSSCLKGLMILINLKNRNSLNLKLIKTRLRRRFVKEQLLFERYLAPCEMSAGIVLLDGTFNMILSSTSLQSLRRNLFVSADRRRRGAISSSHS